MEREQDYKLPKDDWKSLWSLLIFSLWETSNFAKLKTSASWPLVNLLYACDRTENMWDEIIPLLN